MFVWARGLIEREILATSGPLSAERLRPVLILSQDVFNDRSGTVIVMALTSQPQKGRVTPEQLALVLEGLDEIIGNGRSAFPHFRRLVFELLSTPRCGQDSVAVDRSVVMRILLVGGPNCWSWIVSRSNAKAWCALAGSVRQMCHLWQPAELFVFRECFA